MTNQVGRYELWFKAGNNKPRLNGGSFNSLMDALRWLHRIHKQVRNIDSYRSGYFRFYFIDKLTGRVVGSTLDLIDKEK
jgi:hypothetical protein